MFARRSNPSVDKPILRKKMAYLRGQVRSGVADWIDPFDPRKGIIAREMLHFGERAIPVETVSVAHALRALPPLELHGTQFEDPEQNSEKRQDRACLIVRAQAFARLSQLATA